MKYQKAVFVVIAVLVVIAGATYFFYDRVGEETRLYNQFEFVKGDRTWNTEVQHGNRLIAISLRFPPWETETVPITGRLDESFNSGPIYITFDPVATKNTSNMALTAAELSINLAKGINRQLIAACTINETEACSIRPIIDCDNTNESVILLKESEQTYIEFDQNCIIVQGNGKQLLKAVDQLLYYWYGILK